jgi:hypothetical protein
LPECIALSGEPGPLFGMLALPGSGPLRQRAGPDVESSEFLRKPLECLPGADCSPVALGGKFGTSFVGLRCRLRVREHGCLGGTGHIQ